MKTRSPGPLIALVALLVGLAVAEAVLRVVRPIEDPYASHKLRTLGVVGHYIRSEFPPHYRLVTETEEDLRGIEGEKNFSINNMGFRGDELRIPKPGDEYRIFIVGGSTTECIYLDDAECLSRVLQNDLTARLAGGDKTFKVYGAGKAGDASDDHVSMLAHRILHLEPDLLILFCGVNDLIRSIYKYDYLHMREYGYERPRRIAGWKLFATDFQLGRYLELLARRASRREADVMQRVTRKSNYREKIALRKAHPPSDQPPRLDLKPYENNLNTIAGMARAHGIPVVFMTHQTTWASPVDPGTREWHWMLHENGVTYREDLMDRAMEQLNDAMRRVAGESGMPLFDLPTVLPKSIEYFYDDCHFNVQGALAAGTHLAAFLIRQNVVP